MSFLDDRKRGPGGLSWRRRVAQWVLIICAFSLLGPHSHAQQFELNEVSVEFEYKWAPEVSKGYVPIRVHLESTRATDTEVAVFVLADSWNREPTSDTTRSVLLDAGARSSFELLVPAFTARQRNLSFNGGAVVDGDSHVVSLGFSTNSYSVPLRNLLLLTNERFAPGTAERLALAFKTDNLPPKLTYSRGTAVTPALPNVKVTVVDFGALPSSYQAYTSMDGILVDLQHGEPRAEQLLALASWARLGGRVAFVGEDPLQLLESVPGLDVAFESRFELRPEAAPAGDANREFRQGTGRFFLASRDQAIDSEANVELVQRLLFPDGADQQTSWVPSRGDWRMGDVVLNIPGIGELPLRTFLVVLFLFSVLLGPVNFVLLRRFQRPGLMLVTVPMLSLLVSAGILTYGIFSQGVDIKSASQSLTILDQRTRRASTIEARTMYVGMAPGSGLLPDAGTIVLPLLQDTDYVHYEIDSTRRSTFGGSFLPVREPVSQVYLSDTPARLRLHVRKTATGIEVENAFAQAIEGLVLRDEEGQWFGTGKRVAAGAKQLLTALPDGPFPRQREVISLERFSTEYQIVESLALPPSSYVTRLASAPFADSCGLELNELSGVHVLMGILHARAEDWE